MTMTPEQSAEALAVLRRLTSERPVVATSEAYDGDEPTQEFCSPRESDLAADRYFHDRGRQT